ncbi:MAG: Asp23/Gls24 family envelope stress response protein [Clostridiales bacterium]|jgi:uncharacterized alkaline shock family protein YloU|nr:Asp23/Gls24 family envelope stress response protein [Clostridiales bacterium]
MTEIERPENGFGRIHIADDVISAVAAAAAMESQGVYGLGVGFTGDVIDFIGGRKHAAKGVRISVKDGVVKAELSLFVKFGHKIQDTALEVQRKVKSAVETMTGLSVGDISVIIAGVVPQKRPRQARAD